VTVGEILAEILWCTAASQVDASPKLGFSPPALPRAGWSRAQSVCPIRRCRAEIRH